MHEQNFEKQVQQKMDELSLAPSAPVWQKVEAQIRKKKDRRRLIFWLLPLLLVGGGSYWLLSGHQGSHTPVTGLTQQQPAAPKEQQQSVPATSTPAYTKEEKNSTASVTKAILGTSSTHSSTTLSQSSHQPKHAVRSIAPQPGAVALQKEAHGEKESLVIPEEEGFNNNDVAINKETKNHSQPATDTTFTQPAADVIQKKADAPVATHPVAKPLRPAADSANIAVPAPVKKAIPSKWQWAVHAEAGVTSVQSSLFQLPSARAQDMMGTPASGSGGSGNFFYYTPPPLEDGAAFSAGVTLKRQLSSRTRLTAGLQYHFYSTHLTVGQEVDADTTLSYASGARTITKHYRPGNPATADAQNDYRNQYHFMELPVGVEYQLLRRLPLQLQAGLSLAQMIGTNALLYDYSARIYYQNSSAFHKTQLHLFSNLTYTLWKGKTRTLNVGPYAQYGLTQLQKTGTDKNRLFSAGVRTQFSF